MKVLVAVQDYPNNRGGRNEAFVHTRNIEYQKAGIEVDVLNFSAPENYIVDGINVITKDSYNSNNSYDFLLCHAPNIRNHYRFIQKYRQCFKRIIFFFHGHEVLRINRVYPKDYPYIKKSAAKKLFQDAYDTFKLSVWKRYFSSTQDNFHCVFVSHWMYDEFSKWVGASIEGKYSIIYNVIGPAFFEQDYDSKCDKKFDFVAIRSNLDGAKYCVDFINDIATHNPDCSFLLVGRGQYFKHYEKAPNLTWMDTTLKHDEILDVLNSAKCALMPTRTDAQGVMACEFATFGIPMITSDIDVCHEVFASFENVTYIDNDDSNIDIDAVYSKLNKHHSIRKNPKYSVKNTIQKEVELMEEIIHQ